MELEYSDKNSRRSKVYIAVGLIVALVVGATVFVALQASGLTADSDVEMRSVVVAVRDIPARKSIEEGDVAVREVVADQTNETAFTRLDEVLGRVAGIPVATGQLVTRNVLASTTEGQAFSILDLGRRVRPGRSRPARGQPHRGRRERGRRHARAGPGRRPHRDDAAQPGGRPDRGGRRGAGGDGHSGAVDEGDPAVHHDPGSDRVTSTSSAPTSRRRRRSRS